MLQVILEEEQLFKGRKIILGSVRDITGLFSLLICN